MASYVGTLEVARLSLQCSIECRMSTLEAVLLFCARAMILRITMLSPCGANSLGQRAFGRTAAALALRGSRGTGSGGACRCSLGSGTMPARPPPCRDPIGLC